MANHGIALQLNIVTTALSAVTANAVSDIFAVPSKGVEPPYFTVQTVAGAHITAYTVSLDISLDGTNFVSAGTATTVGGLYVYAKPCKFVRVTLTGLTNDGTSDVVTISVLAV